MSEDPLGFVISVLFLFLLVVFVFPDRVYLYRSAVAALELALYTRLASNLVCGTTPGSYSDTAQLQHEAVFSFMIGFPRLQMLSQDILHCKPQIMGLSGLKGNFSTSWKCGELEPWEICSSSATV